VYFVLLRFIVQRLSFCQMQNSKDGHARRQSGFYLGRMQGGAGGKMRIKSELDK
jgi:hypothetical protein